jgi:hypothetical protein
LFNVVVYKNVRLSEVIVSDILDSDHSPIVFHLLDHVRTRNLSGLVDKFTDWEQFKIQINSRGEAYKVAADFTASIALVYRLSLRKITHLDLNNDLPGLKSLLKHN